MVNRCEKHKQITHDIFDHVVQSIVLMSVTAKLFLFNLMVYILQFMFKYYGPVNIS